MDIYNYLSYRNFLRDAYLEKKASDKTFNHQKISRLTGLKSTGFFSWVLSGKRNISTALMDKFARVFGLNKQESDFFALLVGYDQAKTHEVKNEFFQKVIKHKHSRYRAVAPDHYNYFKNWYNAVIREVIAIKPFSGDYKALAHSLRPRITPDQARKSIALLVKLGFARKNNQGTYEHVSATLTTPSDWKSIVISNFQTAMLELSKKSLENYEREERDVSTLTLSGSEELFAEFKSKLGALRKEFIEKAMLNDSPDKVFQINMQVFPVSQNLNAQPEGGPT